MTCLYGASPSHTDTPHVVGSSGRTIGPTQKPQPDNTQHSQQINIHVPGGIRTHNPSKREATDPHLIRRGHCLRDAYIYIYIYIYGPVSSVGIETDYGLDGPGSNPGGDEFFRPSRPALETTQPPVQWVPGLSRG